MSDEADLKLARECAAEANSKHFSAETGMTDNIRAGHLDALAEVQSALLAIKAERARRCAQTVAWLREQSAMRFRLADDASDREVAAYNFTRGIAVGMAAAAIERGEHGE